MTIGKKIFLGYSLFAVVGAAIPVWIGSVTLHKVGDAFTEASEKTFPCLAALDDLRDSATTLDLLVRVHSLLRVLTPERQPTYDAVHGFVLKSTDEELMKLEAIHARYSSIVERFFPGERGFHENIHNAVKEYSQALLLTGVCRFEDPSTRVTSARLEEARQKQRVLMEAIEEAYEPEVREFEERGAVVNGEIETGLGYTIAGSFLVLLFAAGLGAIVSRRIAAPIAALTAVSVRVSKGELEARASLCTRARPGDETDILASAFNSMVDQMTHHLEELRAAKVEAEAANRAKSEFLANMSHEIRTPMTAILGFADSLVDESLPPLERREAVETIRRNGEHLLQIINDILDLSKIEAGKMSVELIGCSTCSILAEVQSFMAPIAASKQLALGVEFLTPIPERIRTDPVRLRQILLNLVGNSLKFTESGGVRLVIRHVPDAVSALQLDIVDTGIGMTPEQAVSIFSAFQQADASTTRRFGGTGLGLTISKRLANLLGGDVEFVETGPGLGTRFRVTILTGPLDGVSMVTSPRDAVGVQTHLPEPPPATCRPLRGRILLAEDGVDNQRLIALVLRKAGADVTIVENGKLAVDRIVADAGEPFDLVLMDMQMPVMDGYAATGALRKAGCSLPIIALTAHAMEGEREKCLAAGCDEYVTKPIQRAKLIEIIRQYVEATASSSRSLAVGA